MVRRWYDREREARYPQAVTGSLVYPGSSVYGRGIIKPGGLISPNRGIIRADQAEEAANYDPITALGTDLIEYWDASRIDSVDAITDSTYINAVGHWYGLIGGYDLAQSTPLLKPTYSPTGLAGGPCISFDGVQQYLTCVDAGLMAILPKDAVPCEMWVLCSQDIEAADATTRYMCGYAATSVVNGRALARLPIGGVNRARAYTGTGGAATTATGTAVDFSGVHVIRGIHGATQTSLEVDSGTKINATVTPVTSTPAIFRVGCIPASGASNYFKGKIAAVFVTKPLTDPVALALHAYLG